MGRSKSNKGYAVAVLVAIEDKQTTLWQLFSRKYVILGSVRRESVHQRNNPYYNYFEAIVDKIRPLVKSGLRTILIVSPPKIKTGQEFQDHLNAHHGWLTKDKSIHKIAIGVHEGIARTRDDMDLLLQNEEFKQLLVDSTAEEGDRIVELFNKRFNSPESDTQLLYILEDIEKLFANEKLDDEIKPEYLLMTEIYFAQHKQGARTQRIMALAKNAGFKVKVLELENPAGEKVAEFGGLVCLLEKTKKEL